MKSAIFLILFSVCMLHAASQSSPDAPLSEFGLTFKPDYTFKGSRLAGWHTLGDVVWRAAEGTITASAKPGAAGGLLVLDSSYQDVGFYSLFKTTGTGETAILLRMEKTDGGFKAVMVSLKQGDIAVYDVKLNDKGQITDREMLRQAGGISYRIAPPPDTSAGRRGNMSFSRPTPVIPADLPFRQPNTEFRENDWNQVEIFLEENVIRTFLNDGREIGGAIDGDWALSGFGPIALYASGGGEISFKNIMYKDISVRHTPTEKSSPRFKVQRINDHYYSWGSNAADFNRDGHMDIVAGAYVHYGPEFTTHKEIYPAIAVGPSKDFTPINHQFTYDVNNDGWPDVITGWTSPTVYINPKTASRRWESYKPIPGTQSETTLFLDIDKDGKPELIYASQGQFKYSKPEAGVKTWTEFNISQKGYALAHGIGTGDINGDGRLDLVGATGWWEQPEKLDKDVTWKYHPIAFGRYKNRATNIGGAVMAVYDANGDGLNDVVSSLNVHGFGLAWFEQKRNANGEISFVRHMINDDYSQKSVGNVTFSQAHAATFTDIDKDGIPDFVLGKRYFTHLDNLFDPDSYGPPVIYWYRTVRNKNAPGGAEFVPELIHNRSGAGSQITAVDLDKDGKTDLITSTNRGTFIFWNKGR